jgi:hypothetical protein
MDKASTLDFRECELEPRRGTRGMCQCPRRGVRVGLFPPESPVRERAVGVPRQVARRNNCARASPELAQQRSSSMPLLPRSWVHPLFFGKRPETGNVRFCRLCWPGGEPAMDRAAEALAQGWQLQSVFEGCVPRPQVRLAAPPAPRARRSAPRGRRSSAAAAGLHLSQAPRTCDGSTSAMVNHVRRYHPERLPVLHLCSWA